MPLGIARWGRADGSASVFRDCDASLSPGSATPHAGLNIRGESQAPPLAGLETQLVGPPDATICNGSARREVLLRQRLDARNQNWLEVEDLGYGFFKEGRLLPLTPYHDFDQVAFEDALGGVTERQGMACVVTDAGCMGEDGIERDPDFCWRVYSWGVRVYRVTLGQDAGRRTLP